MPNYPGVFDQSTFQRERLTFSLANVTASQTGVALKVNANDATSGSLNITGIPMPDDGSITDIVAVLTNNKTAGVLTFTPTINGSAITAPSSLVAVALANTTKSIRAKADGLIARFKAGDLIGVNFTTDGSFAAGATPDMLVDLYVFFEGVQR